MLVLLFVFFYSDVWCVLGLPLFVVVCFFRQEQHVLQPPIPILFCDTYMFSQEPLPIGPKPRNRLAIRAVATSP